MTITESERRANAVIYILTKYKMPLSGPTIRLREVGTGSGEHDQVGSSKNGRVEIRLMINKGIAGSN
jgi:hypothetical protein